MKNCFYKQESKAEKDTDREEKTSGGSAEKKLMTELEIGLKSGQEKGWLTFEEVQKEMLK